MKASISAKAIQSSDRSDGMLVSFEHRWLDPFLNDPPRAVLRKRVPTLERPKWLYIYVNSPASMICGRIRIKEIQFVSLLCATKLADKLLLSGQEIKSYFGGLTKVGLYMLDTMQLANKPTKLAWIKKRMFFFPPQSFLFLSRKAKRVIDGAAGFAN